MRSHPSPCLQRSGEKPSIADAHPSVGEWSPNDTGEYTLTFTAVKAGTCELHLWCDEPDRRGERHIMPGSPFLVRVQAGKADPMGSEVAGFSTEGVDKKNADKKDTRSQAAPSSQTTPTDGSAVPGGVVAGEFVVVRPVFCDKFGNLADVVEDAVSVHLSTEEEERKDDKVETSLPVQSSGRGGLTTYECRHVTSKSGTYFLHVRLHGHGIKGSPVRFRVAPAIHDRDRTIIKGPKSPKLMVDETYTCLVRLRDRFNNFLDTGGAAIAARLMYVKQGSHDSNLLNSQNHEVKVEDKLDGTYMINFGLLQRNLTNWPLTVNLVINADKDAMSHPTGVDIDSTAYMFYLNEDSQASKVEKPVVARRQSVVGK